MAKLKNYSKITRYIILLLAIGIGGLIWKSTQGFNKSLSKGQLDEIPSSKAQKRTTIDDVALSGFSQIREPHFTENGSANSSEKTIVGKHQVSVRTRPNAKAYILERELTAPELAKVTSLGGRVTPSVSGRTAPVLRFDTAEEARSDAQIRKALTEAKIGQQGQLLEFRMKVNPDHNHEYCGSCVAANHSIVSQAQGVISLPVYLGDATGEAVDVVVDPSLVSSQDLITLLEVDHTQPHLSPVINH